MILFAAAAGLILAYGVAYVVFCIKKGGIAAALSVFGLLLTDLLLLVALVYFRVRT